MGWNTLWAWAFVDHFTWLPPHSVCFIHSIIQFNNTKSVINELLHYMMTFLISVSFLPPINKLFSILLLTSCMLALSSILICWFCFWMTPVIICICLIKCLLSLVSWWIYADRDSLSTSAFALLSWRSLTSLVRLPIFLFNSLMVVMFIAWGYML